VPYLGKNSTTELDDQDGVHEQDEELKGAPGFHRAQHHYSVHMHPR